MLFDQIAKKRPEGVTPFLFRQNAGNIARNRICSSGADFPMYSGELMFRQADGDLRPCHTNIIPSRAMAVLRLHPLRSFESRLVFEARL